MCPICNNPLKKRKNRNSYYKTCGNKICVEKNRYNSVKITNLEKYGVENTFQVKEYKEKSKLTCVEKYGVENASQSEFIKDKKSQTCLLNYGVLNPSKNKEIQDKKILNSLDKYGVEYPFQSEVVKDKILKSNINNLGVNYPMQSKEVRKKSKDTCLERYGVGHILQDKTIFEKNRNSSYKLKSYILPSGKEIKIQGYENKFLDEYFLNGGLESNILIEIKDIHNHIGIIYYNTNDSKKHRYYPDIYLINENKIIEVKSNYTITCNKEINELKKQACLNKGLNFEYKIY